MKVESEFGFLGLYLMSMFMVEIFFLFPWVVLVLSCFFPGFCSVDFEDLWLWQNVTSIRRLSRNGVCLLSGGYGGFRLLLELVSQRSGLEVSGFSAFGCLRVLLFIWA